MLVKLHNGINHRPPDPADVDALVAPSVTIQPDPGHDSAGSNHFQWFNLKQLLNKLWPLYSWLTGLASAPLGARM